MRTLVRIATIAVASVAVAQSPLTTVFQTAGNQGNVGGGIYFNLTVSNLGPITINQIDFNAGANTVAGTVGTLTVFMGPSTWSGNVTNPGLWTAVATGAVTTAANGTPTPCALNGGGFTLNPGTYGIALQSQVFNWGYSNVPPGALTYSTLDGHLTFTGGGAQNIFLSPTAPVFSPRIFNGTFHYQDPPTQPPITVASQEAYGAGCYGRWTSFYEVQGNPIGNDLSNTTIHMAFAGDHYNVSMGGLPYTAPTGAATVVNFVTLGATNNSTFLASAAGLAPTTILWPDGPNSTQVATDLEISTDGYISPAPETNPADATPTFGEFLNGGARWAPHWKDQDPIALGNMTLEVEAGTGAYVVSYNGVQDNQGAGVTTTSTYQVAFFPNGDVEYRYGTVSQNGGGSFPELTGWTLGANLAGPALDRGSIDITAQTPFSTANYDNSPLTVALSARPVLGTGPNVVISNYGDATHPFTGLGVMVLSFQQVNPGIPLSAIGFAAPQCFLNVGNGSVSVFFAALPGPHQQPFINPIIPLNPTFNGALVYLQVGTFTSGYGNEGNTAGILTSNGLRLRIGSL